MTGAMAGGEGRGDPSVPSIRARAAFEGETESIAEARRFAADFLTRLRERGAAVSPGAAGSVQLVVSELVTNAMKYAPGPCLLDLELVGDRLEITVWDSSPELPVVAPPEPGRVGGHGLEIVAALTLGLEVRRTPVGKCVTGRVAVLAAGT
ncbi:ATP-binding protein [Streptomyces sp. NPDC052701]|uniref:ATP-binding protein n=1 Tax=Streptomyces sp. NPDC052701 TaxID=3155533 RepID=UPI00343342ED